MQAHALEPKTRDEARRVAASKLPASTIHRNASSLVAGHQMRRRSPARLAVNLAKLPDYRRLSQVKI
jgi:hypothetical protein